MSANIPPTGEPGFDLYANQQGRIIASSVAFILLTTAFVSLRLLSRRLSKAGLWVRNHCDRNVDGLHIDMHSLLYRGLQPHVHPYGPVRRFWRPSSRLITPAEIHHGYGRHIYIYSPQDASAKKRLWLRTLYVFEPLYHTSTTFAKYSILAFYYRVTPVQSFWDDDVSGHCINIDRMFIASGSVNVVLDFIIFAMPIPLLWRLRTSFNQKLVLTAIFTVAG
ncbi:MAG: hypothetical protein Q9173_007156, partial [Seirophora scorigena]